MMADDRVRVVIADDHAAVRAGLRLMLETSPDIEVVAETSDGAGAVAAARRDRPDLVVMDIRMPGMDGIAATRSIVNDRLADVLVLTTFDIDDYVQEALRAGAAGFLLKTAEPSELVAAVRRVAAGDAVLAPEVTRRLLPRLRADVDVSGPRLLPASVVAALELLTPREREVFAALGRGCSNHQISQQLRIAEATVKTHVSRVLAKLGASTRMQAAVLARQAEGADVGGHWGAPS